jgi:hypothetical protein
LDRPAEAESVKNCWDIKKECPFRDTDPAEARRPAYAGHETCRDFDWLTFYGGLPDGPEKAEWKRLMLEWCSSCEIRESHAGEVDWFVDKLRVVQQLARLAGASSQRAWVSRGLQGGGLRHGTPAPRIAAGFGTRE